MAIPTYAEELVKRILRALEDPSPASGDLRRTASDAYYAVFHLLTQCAAEMVCPDAEQRPSIARTIDHKRLREVADRFGQARRTIGGVDWFSRASEPLREIARMTVRLQGARILADYGGEHVRSRAEVESLVRDAQTVFELWPEVEGQEAARAFL